VSHSIALRVSLSMRVLSRTALLAALGACSGSTTEPSLAPLRSTERVPGISVSLTVTPSRVAPGDSIEFVATAHNSSNQSVQIGVQCGPSFDVALTGPGGYAASVLALFVGPNGAFTCELSPRHYAPANGTQAARFKIAAPQRLGRYVAVAGLRRADGLSNLSASVTIVVH
jgi:hypothetical protein